jgi:hypothetical protein
MPRAPPPPRKPAKTAKKATKTTIVKQPIAPPLPKQKALPGTPPAAYSLLREQYKTSLADVDRAQRRLKNAREAVASCEQDVVNAGENKHLPGPQGTSSTDLLVRALLREREREQEAKEARANLKAARNSYLNHVDEEL